MIKVPDTIQIGGHLYSIEFDGKLKDDNSYGQVNYRTQKIHINPDRPTSQKLEALIHEILHIISNVYIHSRRFEESDISGISEGLTQVLLQFGIELDWSSIREKEERT